MCLGQMSVFGGGGEADVCMCGVRMWKVPVCDGMSV